VSRRKFFASVAQTDTLILPIHFPTPTVGLIRPLGAALDYRFQRDWRRKQRYACNGAGVSSSEPV